MNRTEPNQTAYEPRPGTVLAALQNVPGASILQNGRMTPVADVLAERQAAADRAEAEKRAFAEKRAADARRQAETDAANAARVQAEADARRADQAIVDAANAAAAAAYDHDTIVVKIRHDRQIGSRERVMRVHWRRGDEAEFRLAPQSAQNLIAGCTSERAAAEVVATKVASNGFKIRAFYHENGLRELLEGPAPSGPQTDPNRIVYKGQIYGIGDENSRWKGFAGRQFTVRFHDGREVVTTNLNAGRDTDEPDTAVILENGRPKR